MSSETRTAAAVGLSTVDLETGKILDAWYPAPALGARADAGRRAAGAGADRRAARRAGRPGHHADRGPRRAARRRGRRVPAPAPALAPPQRRRTASTSTASSASSATSRGRASAPSTSRRSSAVRTRCRAEGRHLEVYGVDKFPRMTDYVVPEGVRIADADRVRLGAHLAEGTTVMHEGFVNYNAGTLGASMVEGRISAGVVVGDGSDIGGGASIMGTLSGGGTQIISIGERCLLGANAGLGISLGDECIVEAGLYLTAGTRVTMPDGEVVKALELSGANNLLFRRNSQTGAVEAQQRSGVWGGLNEIAARKPLSSCRRTATLVERSARARRARGPRRRARATSPAPRRSRAPAATRRMPRRRRPAPPSRGRTTRRRRPARGPRRAAPAGRPRAWPRSARGSRRRAVLVPRHDRRALDERLRRGADVRPVALEGADELGVAGHEARPVARHRRALGERVEREHVRAVGDLQRRRRAGRRRTTARSTPRRRRGPRRARGSAPRASASHSTGAVAAVGLPGKFSHSRPSRSQGSASRSGSQAFSARSGIGTTSRPANSAARSGTG